MGPCPPTPILPTKPNCEIASLFLHYVLAAMRKPYVGYGRRREETLKEGKAYTLTLEEVACYLGARGGAGSTGDGAAGSPNMTVGASTGALPTSVPWGPASALPSISSNWGRLHEQRGRWASTA